MKDPCKITDHLSPGDALTDLTLVASDEQLARRIAEMALAHLSEAAPEEVATVLCNQLDALGVEGQSGTKPLTRWLMSCWKLYCERP